MSLSAPFALPSLRSLTCLALLIAKDHYLPDVQLVLLYDPLPSLPWLFLAMVIHHTSGCVRHVLIAGINTFRDYVKKCTLAHFECTFTPSRVMLKMTRNPNKRDEQEDEAQ